MLEKQRTHETAQTVRRSFALRVRTNRRFRKITARVTCPEVNK